MGLYDRDYMRDSESPRSISRVVLVLGVVVSLITASSYLLKEVRLFSKSKPKVAVQPTDLQELRDNPLDLNTATDEELQRIPHVSEAIAADIIAARPFRSIDQLLDINGIAEKRLKTIQQYVEEIPIISEPFPDSSETQPAKTEDGD